MLGLGKRIAARNSATADTATARTATGRTPDLTPAAGRAAGGAADRARDIYDRYATDLYRQAFLTPDDAQLAEQVVCDVIVDECRRSPGSVPGADAAGYRLAVSAYRKCRELAAGADLAETGPDQNGPDQNEPGQNEPGQNEPDQNEPDQNEPGQNGPGQNGPGGTGRGALALVLFGGLGYVAASREAGISAVAMAALLRTVLMDRGITANISA